MRRFKAQAGFRSSPADEAARESVGHGCFSIRPTPHVIARLVDFHVAHCAEEMIAGRGLDFESIQKSLEGTWKMVWRKTYSYMGPFYEGGLPRRWGRICRELAKRFPDDGANYCSVWIRT